MLYCWSNNYEEHSKGCGHGECSCLRRDRLRFSSLLSQRKCIHQIPDTSQAHGNRNLSDCLRSKMNKLEGDKGPRAVASHLISDFRPCSLRSTQFGSAMLNTHGALIWWLDTRKSRSWRTCRRKSTDRDNLLQSDSRRMRELGKMLLFFYAIRRSQLAFRIRLGCAGPLFEVLTV